MATSTAFSGRSRIRRTTWSVRVSDVIARWCIRLAGLSTIVAVATVFIFLLATTLPLFWGARLSQSGLLAEADTEQPWNLALDDNQQVAWTIQHDGQWTLQPWVDGRLRPERVLAPLPELGPAPISAAMFSLEGGRLCLAMAEGTVRLGRVTVESRTAPESQAPAGAGQLAPGEWLAAGTALIERRADGSLRTRSAKFAWDGPLSLPDAGRIVALDFADKANGPLVAALDDQGVVHLAVGKAQRNLLRPTQATIHWTISQLDYARQSGAPPQRVMLNGAGDGLYLLWESGVGIRYDVRNPQVPLAAEALDLAPEADVNLSAAVWMLGKTTLVTGDTQGRVRAWFTVRRSQLQTPDKQTLVLAHDLPPMSAAVASLAASSRTRLLAAGGADGALAIYHVTTERRLAWQPAAVESSLTRLAFSPRDNALVGYSSQGLFGWSVDAPHPESGLRAYFAPVWYEGYPAPDHTWQSTSGDQAFEPKLGLWPLVFGTLKATFYSLLFGVPLALTAALYTSEFLHPKTRQVVKPAVELMAGLPSVVLGFLAALVFVRWVELWLPGILATLVTTPLVLLLGAFLWQLLPPARQQLLLPSRLLWITLAAFLGAGLGLQCRTLVERALFAGDIRAWLDGRSASSVGGWVLLLLPVCALVVAVGVVQFVNPWLRALTSTWSRRAAALTHLGKFLVAAVGVLLLALTLGWGLDALGLDARGGVLGRFDPRNSLIVGFVMGFAIIPIIYTISEDALSSVPQHLRSASLGCGATTWQTAVRIVIPTATSGLFSAVMVGLGRAVGETMIVLMATGNTPIRDWNIFSGFRTLSANIAVEMPEAVRGSTHYRTLFLAALVLFAMTFILNTAAEVVRQRYRRRAVQL